MVFFYEFPFFLLTIFIDYQLKAKRHLIELAKAVVLPLATPESSSTSTTTKPTPQSTQNTPAPTQPTTQNIEPPTHKNNYGNNWTSASTKPGVPRKRK